MAGVGGTPAGGTVASMYAIVGALNEEVDALIAALRRPGREVVLGVDIHRGRLDGVPVLLARSGVGKVNAALTAASLVSAGASSIVFTGVAGALEPGLKVGDIVVATDLVQHDVDATAMGYPPGRLLGEPTSWPADEGLRASLLAAARAVAGEGRAVAEGRVASGDQFVASPESLGRIRETFGAVATEMEGAALAQAAQKLGVPCAVVRVISDTADHDAPADFPAFLSSAADIGAAIVRRMLHTLGQPAGTAPRNLKE